MEKIRITFLGTANAVPTKLRNHTSMLLTYKDENMLFDCGEGTQRQFRYAELSPSKITKLLITHWHGDHILGIPGLLQTLGMSAYDRTLKIYGPRRSKYFFSLLDQLATIRIKTEIHEMEDDSIKEKEFLIESKSMDHDTPCNAYAFIIKDKLRLDKSKLKKYKLPNSPLLGDLQAGKDIVHNGKKIKASQATYLEKGRKVVFIMDTAYTDKAVEIAKDADLLIIESTFSKDEEELAKEYKHLTATQAATIAKKANVKALLLTHISQRYEHIPQIIEKEAKRIFKNLKVAKDLDVIEL